MDNRDVIVWKGQSLDGCMWKTVKILLFVLFLFCFAFCVFCLGGLVWLAVEMAPIIEDAIKNAL